MRKVPVKMLAVAAAAGQVAAVHPASKPPFA